MPARTVLRTVTAATAVLAAGVAALVLAAPWWIDATAVQSKIAAWAANASGGHARFSRIELHYLPLPGIVLTDPAFSVPGVVDVQAATGAVDLDVLALLRGAVHPRRVRLERPSVRWNLPQARPDGAPFSLQRLDGTVRELVGKLVDAAPGLDVEIVDATAELLRDGRAPLQVRNVGLSLSIRDGTLEAQGSGTAALFQTLHLTLRVARADLVGNATLEVDGLDVDRLAAVVGESRPWPVRHAIVHAKVEARCHGLAQSAAHATVSAPTFEFGASPAGIEARSATLDLTAQVTGESLQLDVVRAALTTPALALNGSVSWSKREGYRVAARIADVDLPTLQAAASALLPGAAWLQREDVRLGGGTLRTLELAGGGATPASMAELSAWQAQGVVENIDLSLPRQDLRLQDATAAVTLKGAELQVDRVGGRIGSTLAHDGVLHATLGTAPWPLQASLVVDAHLGETLALAKRLVTTPDAARALEQLSRLEGRARLTLSVTGDTARVKPRVDVVSIDASVTHEALPFPLRVTRGSATYADDHLSLSALDGTLGPVRFEGAGAELALSPSLLMGAGSGTFDVALEPLLGWARRQPDWRPRLTALRSVAGHVAIRVSGLEGPLQDLHALRFRLTASPRQVRLDAPAWAPPIALDDGKVVVDPRAIVAEGVTVALLDGALRVSGRTPAYRDGIDTLEATADGTLGPAVVEWLRTRAALPDTLRLRGGLALSDVHARWRRNGRIEASGKVAASSGPDMAFAVTRTPERTEVSEFTVRDADSAARFAGSLEGTRFDARFDGRLSGTSVARLFVAPPITLGRLQGEFRLNGDWRNPGRGTAAGTLEAADVRLPWPMPEPVVIEALALKADARRIEVMTARVHAGDNRVELSGTIDRSNDHLRVDADVHADTITLLTPTAGSESRDDRQSNATRTRQLLQFLDQTAFAGEVRVDVRHLRRGTLEVAPLVGSATLEPRHLDLRIRQASVCALALSGEGIATPDDIDLHLAVHAKAMDLASSSACLTEQRLAVTGLVDVDVDLATKGAPGALLEHVTGNFAATSRDGRIERFDALAKVFDLLNVTEAVHGTLPDLRQKGMAYRTAHVQGRVQGATVRFDEGTLDATGIKIAAQGTVDYGSRKVEVNVLVAPLQTANRILDKLPVIGRIFGGTVLALPVRVGGTLDRPLVIPLGPRAVASRLLDILANTAMLPVDLVRTISTEVEGQASAAPKATGQR